MRVFVNNRRTESGAVAVVVAIMSTALLLMAGFTVDLGQAYVAKRQLQTAADAGALAAASAYAKSNGDCNTVRADPTVNAQAVAEAARAANKLTGIQSLGTTGQPLVISCNDPVTNAYTGVLHVTYTVTGDTPTFFGKLANQQTISSSMKATATLDVPMAVAEGVRPLMLCSNLLPSVLPSIVLKLSGPSQGSAPPVVGCDGGGNPGAWWFVDCPGDNNNGLTVTRILDGCPLPVSVVPNQPAVSPGPYLISYCGTPSDSCLGSSPGAAGQNLARAFDQLISRKEDVFMPVFCGQPTCTPAGVRNAGGNNAVYPVHKLVGLTVCGYRFNNATGEVDWTDQQNIGLCNQNPAGLTAENAGVRGENYLLVVLHKIQTSGSTGPSTCRLGDVTCDGGIRRVSLTQ